MVLYQHVWAPWTTCNGIAYLKGDSTLVVLFPESMNNMHIDKTTCIVVKVRHEKVDVVQVIELPALRDERITEQVCEGHCVDIQVWSEIPDLGEPEGRWDDLSCGCVVQLAPDLRWRRTDCSTQGLGDLDTALRAGIKSCR